MNSLMILFALLSAFYWNCRAIYLTNSSSVRKIETNPAYWTEEGIWGPALEEWAIGGSYREKRVMKIPIPLTDDAFVSDQKSIKEEKESKIVPAKIVNTNNITKKPPPRQVSETDLYLLGAIEKLVYRVDFMEKRLRRVEEMMYYMMAGNRIDHQEPCPGNFTRAGTNCYMFSSSAGREFDWKAASKQCKKLGASLAEMETIEENQDVIAYIQNNQFLRGKDFWTGGLNPGLLWIWSNSARPVSAPGAHQSNKKNPSANILGEGRCLRLAYDPALRSYNYRGTDCSVRYSYICEFPENTSSNELRRLGRSRNIIDEL